LTSRQIRKRLSIQYFKVSIRKINGIETCKADQTFGRKILLARDSNFTPTIETSAHRVARAPLSEMAYRRRRRWARALDQWLAISPSPAQGSGIRPRVHAGGGMNQEAPLRKLLPPCVVGRDKTLNHLLRYSLSNLLHLRVESK